MLLFRSGVVAVAAVAVLLGQLLNVVHLVLVQHQPCLEHGDMVHAGTGARPDAIPHETAALVVEAVEGHTHDHCLVIQSTRQATLTPPAGAVTASDPALSAITPAATFAPSQSRRWVLAPKTSPPRDA